MTIKTITIIFVALGALGLIAYGFSSQTTPNRNMEQTMAPENAFIVTLTADGYDPAEFTIPKGTAVTFVSTTGKPHWPASNLHPSHEIYAAFDPLRPVDPDETWTFVFDKEGTWNFHDHMRAYYTGTVIVTPAE